jgi:hypothetical protein
VTIVLTWCVVGTCQEVRFCAECVAGEDGRTLRPSSPSALLPALLRVLAQLVVPPSSQGRFGLTVSVPSTLVGVALMALLCEEVNLFFVGTCCRCVVVSLVAPCDTLVVSQVPFEELCLLLGPLLEALATSVASAGSGGRETMQDTTAAVVAFADGLLAVLSISVTLQTNIRKARPLSSFFFLCCLCHPQVAGYRRRHVVCLSLFLVLAWIGV